jgi:hypothetical protein
MAVKFHPRPGIPLKGFLRYSRSDRGFSFEVASLSELAERSGGEGRASLVVDSLQLEVGIGTEEILFAWGYFPMESWQKMVLNPPRSTRGRVTAEVNPPLEEAVSVSVSRSNWNAAFDQASGWIRVFHSPTQREDLFEIAEGVHLGLIGESLNSIWLHPIFCE